MSLDKDVVESLNSIGLGTAILIGTGVIGFLAYVYKSIKQYLTIRDTYRDKKIEDSKERENLKEAVENIVTAMNDMNNGLTELHKSVDAVKSDITELKVTSSNNDAMIKVLLDSDKETIKSYILDQHALYIKDGIPVKTISISNLGIIERLYKCYLAESPNDKDIKVMEKLVEDLRKAPLK